MTYWRICPCEAAKSAAQSTSPCPTVVWRWVSSPTSMMSLTWNSSMRSPNCSTSATGSSPALTAQPTSSWKLTYRGSVFSTRICQALLSVPSPWASTYSVVNSLVWLWPKIVPVPFFTERSPSRFSVAAVASTFS
jgi:hypothetical protein